MDVNCHGLGLIDDDARFGNLLFRHDEREECVALRDANLYDMFIDHRVVVDFWIQFVICSDKFYMFGNGQR